MCHIDRELLGIYWRNKFYVDRCLPFGLQSAPYTFNQFAEALEWILHNNQYYSIAKILHYLDDFLIVSHPKSEECAQAITTTLQICLSHRFRETGRANCSHYLSWHFAGCQSIATPATRRQAHRPHESARGLEDNPDKSHEEETAIFDWQALVCSEGGASRTLFLRQLIDLSTKVKKLHHCIYLSASARADIQWWLPGWNGVSFMLHSNWESAADMDLTTDASGYGAY